MMVIWHETSWCSENSPYITESIFSCWCDIQTFCTTLSILYVSSPMGRVCCSFQLESLIMLAKEFSQRCIWQSGDGTRRYIYAMIVLHAIHLIIYRWHYLSAPRSFSWYLHTMQLILQISAVMGNCGHFMWVLGISDLQFHSNSIEMLEYPVRSSPSGQYAFTRQAVGRQNYKRKRAHESCMTSWNLYCTRFLTLLKMVWEHNVGIGLWEAALSGLRPG